MGDGRSSSAADRVVEEIRSAGGEAVAHAWQSDRVGFEMTSGAFAAAFPFEVGSIPIGTLVASIALLLFVFTTLLTWSYYGERAITFLYDRMKGSTREGEKKLHMVWRVLWCVVIFIGAAQPSEREHGRLHGHEVLGSLPFPREQLR